MISLFKRRKQKETIVEYYPTNPDTVIVKNQFYPKGLTELDLYNYYIKNKNRILAQIKGREVMFFLGLETDDPIVKRKTPEGKFIKLTNSNYKDLITGRTLSIHSTMNKKENFGIVDVDCDHFRKARVATQEVYDYLKNDPNIKVLEIRFTGKDGFHIICVFKKIYNIDNIRLLLKETLSKKFDKQYDIAQHKKTSGKVNLDLSSNKYRGGFITLNSLSVIGLKCIIVSRSRLGNFRKEEAKII
jgi:hypothetical protein